jgi:hypothetical protein
VLCVQTAPSVMAGLVAAIHAAPFPGNLKLSGGLTTWMPATSPVMTALVFVLTPGPALPYPPGLDRLVLEARYIESGQ